MSTIPFLFFLCWALALYIFQAFNESGNWWNGWMWINVDKMDKDGWNCMMVDEFG